MTVVARIYWTVRHRLNKMARDASLLSSALTRGFDVRDAGEHLLISAPKIRSDSRTLNEFVWEPSQAVIEQCRLHHLVARCGANGYLDLVERAAADPAWFWGEAAADLGFEFLHPYDRVLDTSQGPAWSRWWVGAKLNIVHNCLDRYRGSAAEEKLAIRWEGEAGAERTLTYRELDELVCHFATGLLTLGVAVGDRVGLFLPQVPETVVSLLACAKIGAVAVPIFSGYGPEAVAERLNACEAKVLVCADGFSRRGRIVAMKPVADAAVAKCAAVQHVVVVPFTGAQTPWNARVDRRWESLLEVGANAETAMMDPESPLLIVYTSGTTGRPKGVLHVHGGFPIKALADMVYGFDVHQDDVVFWYTDIGWIMAPWLAFGTLTVGATMVLYEGAPDTPDSTRLWRLAANQGISVLGLSPTLVRSLMSAENEFADLPQLRVLGSTGEMWDRESWMWLFENVGRSRVPIVNYSGGTEIGGGILCGNLLTPLKPTAFAGPLPGMAADVIDDAGESVRGVAGELVLRGPNPGLTWGFWNDDARYLETYWSRRPGVWVHGDRCLVDERDGLWYMHGRSDDTIKTAGKRLGPGEVEDALDAHPAVAASAALGIFDQVKGESLACLVVLREDSSIDEKQLEEELAARVVGALGKSFKPKLVAVVPDLPRTRNGKVVRRVAKAALSGADPGDLSALDNPQVLSALAEVGLRRGIAGASTKAPDRQ